MGNTGSNAVSWWSAYEIAAKNFDPERFPRAVSNAGQANVTAENAVIFNIGVIEKRGFDAFSVTIISLSANGYQNQTGETATAGMATQTQLQHGFTYCCHKTCLESGSLNLQVMNGDQVVAEQSIPVKSLVGKASSKKFFQHDVIWGGDDNAAKTSNNSNLPIVKLGFELLSIGDGKIHMAKEPFFLDLELANVKGHALRKAGHPSAAYPYFLQPT